MHDLQHVGLRDGLGESFNQTCGFARCEFLRASGGKRLSLHKLHDNKELPLPFADIEDLNEVLAFQTGEDVRLTAEATQYFLTRSLVEGGNHRRSAEIIFTAIGRGGMNFASAAR